MLGNWVFPPQVHAKRILDELPSAHLASARIKTIDFKSLLIGFLLAVTLFLAMGATGGTQNVRIVGVDKSFTDWDALKVEVQK